MSFQFVSVVLPQKIRKVGVMISYIPTFVNTKVHFAASKGIPRTTLRGHLKGTSYPRADSLEELAGKLGIFPAELGIQKKVSRQCRHLLFGASFCGTLSPSPPRSANRAGRSFSSAIRVSAVGGPLHTEKDGRRRGTVRRYILVFHS